MVEEPGHRPAVSGGFPDPWLLGSNPGRHPIGRRVSHGDLAPHMAVACFYEPPCFFLDLLEAMTRSVGVEGGGPTALASEELVDWHSGELALYIPQGHIHARERIVEHRPLAPVRTKIARLIYIFDGARVPAYQQGLEIFLDRLDHSERALGEG